MNRLGLLGTLGLLLGLVVARETSAADVKPALEPVLARIETQKQSLAAGPLFNLARDEGELHQAVDQFSARLREINDVNWIKYLRWSEFQQLLAKPAEASIEALETFHRRFTAARMAWNEPTLAEVARGVSQYLAHRRAAAEKITAEQTRLQLDELSRAVTAYIADPSAKNLAAIETVTTWLHRHGLATEVTMAVAGRLSHPNVVLHISAQSMKETFDAALDERFRVGESMSGAWVHGQGRLAGQQELVILPSANSAQMELKIVGATHANTRSEVSGVTIPGQANTQVTSVKRITIDHTGIYQSPALASASAHISQGSVQGGGLIKKWIVQKKAAEAYSYNTRETARRTANRIAGRLDREADEQIDKVNEQFVRDLRDPVLRAGVVFDRIDMSSTAQEIAGLGWLPRASGFAAPTTAPTPPVAPIAAQFHETLPVAAATAAWSGKTVPKRDVMNDLSDLLGTDSGEASATDDWSIRFGPGEPLTVAFDPQAIKVVVHAEELLAPGRSYPAMNIFLEYRWVWEKGELRLTRAQPMRAYPADYVPGGGKALSGRQQTVRQAVERLLAPAFAETYTLTHVRYKKEGRAKLESFGIADHWMSLGLAPLKDDSNATARK